MSSKIKLFYILIGLLILFASAKAAVGVQEDFNAYASTKDLYVCSCAASQQDIIVENTGDVTSTYSISQSGRGSEYSALTETAFGLKPGESKSITNFVKIPCGKLGEFDLTTSFNTVFDLKKGFTQKIIAKDCVNINLYMVEAPLPVCPCSPGKYTFTVQNTGTFLETYRASIDSRYAELSEDIIILEPQQSENITVFITTPCGSYGDLGFNLFVLAENSQMYAELPFVMRVAPCYNYTLEAMGQYSVCQDLNNVVPIKIKNLADVKNTYILDADADWAIFENSSATLWGGEEGTVNLNIYPAGIEPANYNITIDSVTVRGEIRKRLNIAANVERCYSFKLLAENNYFQIVNWEQGSIYAVIENDGTRASEYIINLTGPQWMTYDISRISLEPGATKDIEIRYNVPANQTESVSAAVFVSMADFPDKNAAIDMSFDIVSVEDAYRLEIDTPLKKLETNYDGKVIPITITNTGIREGEYSLSYYGNNWSNINASSVKIGPQQTAGIGIVLSPITNVTEEGRYGATIDARLKDTGIVYTRTFDIKLRQKTLWEKVKDFLSNYWLYLLAGLLAILLLLGMIFGAIAYRKKHPKEEKPKKDERFIDEEKPSWLKRILLLLLILLLLAALGFAGYHFAFKPLFMANATNMTNVTHEPVEPEVPVIEEPEPTEPVTNATIFVNRTGLRGYENVIEVIGLENITIPLIIQNSDEPNTYIIKVSENVSWITTDTQVVHIPPSERRTVNIYVTPTPEVEEGNYNLSININIAGREKPISEEIVLSVKEKKPFYEKYLWYIIGGVLALIVLLILLKRGGRKDEELEPLHKEREGPADYSRIRNILLIIMLALIVLALIGALVYFGVMVAPKLMKSEGTADSTANESIEEQEQPGEPVVEEATEKTEETPEPEEVPEEAYEMVFVKKGIETTIPIKILNVNKTTAFRISVKEDVDWLSVENDIVVVGPDENKTVNLMASPDADVEDGNYKVSIDINIANGEKVMSKYFVLKVRKNRFSDMLSYLYYVLGALIVLLVLVKLLGSREKDEEEPVEREEKAHKKKKTSIRLK